LIHGRKCICAEACIALLAAHGKTTPRQRAAILKASAFDCLFFEVAAIERPASLASGTYGRQHDAQCSVPAIIAVER
jgi:hypothetical protein